MQLLFKVFKGNNAYDIEIKTHNVSGQEKNCSYLP